ncbi:Hpt domain-containing protein [Leeia sp. TBRC 13508]|uniref:histidine kinase n=1 Tax=Leeia speluncae TaxID=2884804 RepID=A0ABS8D3H9_9NEIS|nr:Hpt domain-containing protein [Leeia speluncae]MCB6182745.1 Hpt domain-containing protein [Leeia speluncae]
MSTIDFDVGSLIWVKAEIDSAIGLARQQVAQFSANPTDTTQLKFASTHLHQATGAIEMVGLPGLTAFAQAIEGLIASVSNGATANQVEALNLLDKALGQITEYIAALIDGAPNTTLNLFATYQALFEIRGSHQYSESDLFFPDLLIELPERLKSAQMFVGDAKEANRRLRVAYQQGLISFIRSGTSDSLTKMIQPVAELAKYQNTSALRAFWWVAASFIASLSLNARLQGAGKGLLSRLDQQMRRLVDGTPKAPEILLRQMLYFVAIAEVTNSEIEEVRSVYGLSDLLPQQTDSYQVPLVSASEVRELKSLLEQIKDTWTRVTTLQSDKLPHFVALLKQLSGQLKSDELEVLSPLFDGLQIFADGLPAGKMPSETDAMGVATALLLGETALEQYPHWDASLPEQIKHVLAKLHGELSTNSLLDEISQRAQEKLLLSQVAHEIAGSLQQIEQHLDTYFRDLNQKSTLLPVSNLMHQVDGAFMMLGAEKGSQVVRLAAEKVNLWRAEASPVQDDMEHVAEMLSAVGFYVEALQNQRADADKLLESFLGEAAPAHIVDAPLAPVELPVEKQVVHLETEEEIPVVQEQTVSVAASVGELDEPSDLDLLDIYLEEAGEILSGLSEHVLACRANPHDQDSLTTIRRSFHTLKGSGRMVGLTHLGEAAWGVEQVMNRWLQEDRPAYPELLNLIAFARQKFSAWVSALADDGKAVVDSDELNALIDAFKAWQDGPLPNVVVSEAAPAEDADSPLDAVFNDLPSLDLSFEDDLLLDEEITVSDTPAVEDSAPPALTDELPVLDIEAADIEVIEEIAEPPSEYTIGDVTISAVLYGIFVAEANKHLATLNNELEAVANGGNIQSEFTHAAHTLRGIGNTTGFVTVGHLADALEQYLLAKQVSAHSLDDQVFALVSETIAVLHGMVEAIEQFEPPVAADELIARLKATPPVTDAISLEQQLEAMDVEEPIEEISHSEEVSLDLGDIELIDEVPTLEAPVTFPDESSSEEAFTASEEALSFDLSDEETEEDDDALALPVNDLLLQAAEFTPEVSSDFVSDIQEIAEPVESTVTLLDEDSDEVDGTTEALALLEGNEEVLSIDDANELMALADEIVLDEEVASDEVATDDVALEELDAFNGLSELAPLASEAPVEYAFEEDDLVDMPIEDMLHQAMENVLAVQQEELVATSAPAAPASTIQVQMPASAVLEPEAQDEIDEQLLPVFLEEADELLPQIEETLRAWRDSPNDDAQVRQLLRDLHTLKGSARMAGAMRLGELTHSFETRVQQAAQIALLDDALFDGFENELDLLNQYRDVLANPEQVVAAPEVVTTNAVGGEAAPVGGAKLQKEKQELSSAEADAQATLRVRADLIDRLVNEAGEVSIARARIDSEVRGLKQSLFELTDNVNRLRSQLRELEIQAESQMQSRLSILSEGDEAFDPLEFDRFTRLQELTRLLAESVNDVATVQHNLLKNVADSEAALIAQSRQTRDLQQSLMRIRTVPLSTLTDRMYRIVRQTAKDLGKKVNLEIRGARMEIDRSVLEKMTSPFEHLLRNAVDHGLEKREDRLAAGKPDIGEILIEARQEGNEMILTLSDDGAGIDVAKVKAKAIDQGWIQADDVRPDHELLELIFRAGLSTADALTQVSGRGIGMDVVKSEIESLGGRVNVASNRGQGTAFTMRLPLTLAVTQTVLVNVGAHQYAIPSGLVEQVQELKVDALNRCYAEKGIEWQGQMYPFWYLPRLLGDEATMPELARYNTVVLLKSANRRVAIHVDSLTRNQEVVVKNIGPQLARVIGVSGATVLGSGQIVLIINPVELMVHADRLSKVDAVVETYAPQPVIQQQPHILVVDDSLTVRKITSRFLERQGFAVMTAKDGVDALQQIEDHQPDVMLVDIEMPRMDGFELTRNVRGNALTKDIPIIIISSRTAEKHRKVAEDLGVNRFLGKPYQEDELLAEIQHYLNLKAEALA